MSSVIERVKQLALPEGEYVVIGSGLLDALGFRKAHDLDLAVSERLFEALAQSSLYQRVAQQGTEVLVAPSIEIWRRWYEDAPFETLIKDAITVEGVTFVHPSFLIRRKQERGLPKDLKDVVLLKEYYRL